MDTTIDSSEAPGPGHNTHINIKIQYQNKAHVQDFCTVQDRVCVAYRTVMHERQKEPVSIHTDYCSATLRNKTSHWRHLKINAESASDSHEKSFITSLFPPHRTCSSPSQSLQTFILCPIGIMMSLHPAEVKQRPVRMTALIDRAALRVFTKTLQRCWPLTHPPLNISQSASVCLHTHSHWGKKVIYCCVDKCQFCYHPFLINVLRAERFIINLLHQIQSCEKRIVHTSTLQATRHPKTRRFAERNVSDVFITGEKRERCR